MVIFTVPNRYQMPAQVADIFYSTHYHKVKNIRYRELNNNLLKN